MHEMIGDAFDLKQFIDEQPKILNEFNKRIDPELQFYYWSGANERFSEFELPSFNEPSGEGVTFLQWAFAIAVTFTHCWQHEYCNFH